MGKVLKRCGQWDSKSSKKPCKRSSSIDGFVRRCQKLFLQYEGVGMLSLRDKMSRFPASKSPGKVICNVMSVIHTRATHDTSSTKNTVSLDMFKLVLLELVAILEPGWLHLTSPGRIASVMTKHHLSHRGPNPHWLGWPKSPLKSSTCWRLKP